MRLLQMIEKFIGAGIRVCVHTNISPLIRYCLLRSARMLSSSLFSFLSLIMCTSGLINGIKLIPQADISYSHLLNPFHLLWMTLPLSVIRH